MTTMVGPDTGRGEDFTEVHEAVADLVGDVRAWLEWAVLTGGQDWPVAAEVATERPTDGPPTIPRTPQSRAVTQPGPPPRAVGAVSPPPAVQAVAGVMERLRPATPQSQNASNRAAARDEFERIRADIVPSCHRCPRAGARQNVVFGVGRVGAPIFVIGDQPGPDDNLTGEAWSGRVGRLLTRMMRAIGREREDVFMTHVVKCHAPGMPDPTAPEIETCSRFLMRQLKAVGPRVVLALGPWAARVVTHGNEPLQALRGRIHAIDGIPLVISLDPSYLLAAARMKSHAWDDLRLLRDVLAGSRVAD